MYFKRNTKIFLMMALMSIQFCKISLSKIETWNLFQEKYYSFLQDCKNCAKCFKSFKLDGRFNVICLWSLMGINYKEIGSASVGYKEDYQMFSLDLKNFMGKRFYWRTNQQFITDVFIFKVYRIIHFVNPLFLKVKCLK